MASIKHPSEIKFVEAGQNQISASGYNGLIQAARRVDSFARGVTNNSDIRGAKDSTSIRYWIRIDADEDIEPYSIFTVQDGGDGWSLVEPNPLTKKFEEADFAKCVYITNMEDKLFTGADYYLPICDLARPFIFKYADPTPLPHPSIGDPIGPKFGSYEMSVDPDIPSFRVVSDPDQDNLLVWAVKVACDSDTNTLIPMFEFTEVLKPGYVAGARKLKWNPTTTLYELDPNDQKIYKLYDPEEQNMFVPKDRVHGLKKELKDGVGQVFADYEIIGEHGLNRRVRVENADVDCGEIGDVKVFERANRVHPPPDHPDDPDCVIAVVNDANLKVCNQYGWRRKILNQELTRAYWDLSRQAWIFVQEDRASHIEGTSAQGGFCPTEINPGITNVAFMDWKQDACTLSPSPTIDNVSNINKLASLGGDSMHAIRFEDVPPPDEWRLIEVGHQPNSVVLDIEEPESQNETCPVKKWIEPTNASLMYCKPPEKPSLGKIETVVTEVKLDEQSCNFSITSKDVCVLGSTDGATNPIPMGFVNALTGVNVTSGGSPGAETCSIAFTATLICGFVKGPGSGGAGIPIDYVEVGTGISETTSCVDLDRKKIPVIGVPCNTVDLPSQNIYCVRDCEEVPTTVLAEASSAGTYTPQNKETQPYDPTGLNPGDIIIQFPSDAVEGEVIMIANNSLSEIPITIDGNGNNVQAITAPYNSATVSVWGAKLHITYQLRLVGTGPSMVWRII